MIDDQLLKIQVSVVSLFVLGSVDKKDKMNFVLRHTSLLAHEFTIDDKDARKTYPDMIYQQSRKHQ